MNRRGATGEAILMMYRMFLVVIVAFAVFFVVALYYDFYVDSLNNEAIVLNRKSVNCLSDDGFIAEELSDFKYQILDYCKINDGGKNRLYVRINVSNVVYEGGDSGIRAISEMFDSGLAPRRVYRPGFYSNIYDIYSNGKIVQMEVKTYVKSEEK